MSHRNARSILQFLGAVLICLAVTGCGKAGYGKVKGQWAWIGWNAGHGRTEAILDNADAKSFVVLSDHYYAKDQYRVYYKWDEILDADPATFEFLPNDIGVDVKCYSRDQKHVYMMGHRVTGADPKTFELIGDLYGRDKTRVYCGTVPIEGSDPATFQIMLKSGGSCGTMTNKEFFVEYKGPGFENLEISESYPATTSNGAWAKDAKHHYRDASRIEGADYDTFHAIDGIYGADKNHEYMFSFRKQDFERAAQLRVDAAKKKQAELEQRNEEQQK